MAHDIDAIDQAVYDTVHEYRHPTSGKKGAPGLSAITGIKATTLQNKADRINDQAVLNIKEVRTIMMATGDFRILQTLARETDHAVIPLPDIQHLSSDMDLLAAHTRWAADFGETAQAIRDALSDNKVTQSEIEKIRRELIEDFERGLEIIDVMKGMAEPE